MRSLLLYFIYIIYYFIFFPLTAVFPRQCYCKLSHSNTHRFLAVLLLFIALVTRPAADQIVVTTSDAGPDSPVMTLTRQRAFI